MAGNRLGFSSCLNQSSSGEEERDSKSIVGVYEVPTCFLQANGKYSREYSFRILNGSNHQGVVKIVINSYFTFDVEEQ